jgi:tellurite resistance protein
MQHTALIYTMVLMSAADSDMTDRELLLMGDIVRTMPAFEGFDDKLLPEIAENCAEILGQENGMDTILDIVADSLPERLCMTAYALACDVAAADGSVQQEELRLLEMIRHRLSVDRLHAAAIETGAAARNQKVD